MKPGLNRPQAIWSWGTLNQRDSGCLGYLITTPSPDPPGNAQRPFAGILAQIGRKGGLQRSHVSCQPVVMGGSTLAVKGRGQASCEGHVLHSRPPPLPALASLGALAIPTSFTTLEQATLRPSGTTSPQDPLSPRNGPSPSAGGNVTPNSVLGQSRPSLRRTSSHLVPTLAQVYK